MTELNEKKQSIRKQLLSKRLDRQEISDFSISALELVESFKGMVASYSHTDTEPSTAAINEHLAKAGRLVLPAIEGTSLVWKIPDKLVPSKFGIMSPVGESVPIVELDLIIAPALAISVNGTRLGKGGGYYDRALKDYRGEVIAVVFEEEVFDSLPEAEHDRRVDGVLTEQGLKRF